MIKAFPLIILSVFINTAAQLLLKAGMNRIGFFSFSWNNLIPIALQIVVNPFILGGLACYGLAVVVWLLVLSRTEVSVAYPLISMAYVLNTLAAYYLFDEPVTINRIGGILIIMLGVYILARS